MKGYFMLIELKKIVPCHSVDRGFLFFIYENKILVS